jgi:hypothetical protein
MTAELTKGRCSSPELGLAAQKQAVAVRQDSISSQPGTPMETDTEAQQAAYATSSMLQ